MDRKSGILAVVLLFCAIVPFESCVEPVTPLLTEDDSEPVLVVDSQITNEKGPFRVKLTTAVPVNVMYYPEPVLNADVRISDDHGNVYQLTGDNQGTYETADRNLKGIPGYTYTLFIKTRQGEEYESAPELMIETPEIDSVFYKEIKRTTFQDGQAQDEYWLDILLDSHDPDGRVKYWYFTFEETWEVRMITDPILVDHSPPGTPTNFSWERIIVDDEKITCWVTLPSMSILVTSTVNNPVNEINNFLIQSLGPDDEKLHIGYSILAKQSAISDEQYDYWKQLSDANENVGGMYGKIPARVNGNISCCNGTGSALGFFSVVSVQKKRLFVHKSDHQVKTVSAYQGCSYFDYELLPWIPKSYFGTIEGTDTPVFCNSDFCADCRDYGTNVKPDFWK